MRKFFWCSAVAVVAAAGVFYWAADYASHSPETVVGRCVVSAFEMTSDFNPISRVGHSVVHHAHGAIHHVFAAVQPSQPSSVPCCSTPVCKVPQERFIAASAPEAKCEQWDASAMAQGEMLGRISIPDDEEIRRALNPLRETPLDGAEEAEFVPEMPRVADPEDGPGVMERVQDFNDLFLNYADFFKGGEEASSVEPKPSSGRQEEPCEPIEMPVIRDDYHSYHCPQSSSCCPYSGKCSSSYTPYPSVPSPMKPSSGSGEEVSEPDETPARLQKKANSVLTAPPGCSCPKVDTMEFRKTDAQPGQFEKVPY